MSNKKIIIGITGPFGSGKSTAASFFTAEGFTKIVLSSFLEEEGVKRGKPITRALLQEIGNEWRKEYGSGVLAEKAMEQVRDKNIQKVIIDGIRNRGELDVLRREGGCVLIAIIANKKVRFDRLKNVKRRELLTWELFNTLDEKDLGIDQPTTGLRVADCIALADIFIENNKDESTFQNKLGEVLKEHIL